MGNANGIKTIACSDETASGWGHAKRAGCYILFQIPDAGEALYIDGSEVDTGLDGAAGWFETRLGIGTHTARLGSGETVTFDLAAKDGFCLVIR